MGAPEKQKLGRGLMFSVFSVTLRPCALTSDLRQEHQEKITEEDKNQKVKKLTPH